MSLDCKNVYYDALYDRYPDENTDCYIRICKDVCSALDDVKKYGDVIFPHKRYNDSL